MGIPFSQRVFSSQAEAEAAKGNFPESSRVVYGVYADPEKLEAALELAKAGKPIGWVVEDSAGWAVSDIARTVGFSASTGKKAPTVIVKEVEKQYTIEELKAKIAEAEARLKAEKAAKK